MVPTGVLVRHTRVDREQSQSVRRKLRNYNLPFSSHHQQVPEIHAFSTPVRAPRSLFSFHGWKYFYRHVDRVASSGAVLLPGETARKLMWVGRRWLWEEPRGGL